MRTYRQTVDLAKRISRKNGTVLFIVDQFEEYNNERYHIATKEDLDTFWQGVSDKSVIHSIVGGEIED